MSGLKSIVSFVTDLIVYCFEFKVVQYSILFVIILVITYEFLKMLAM